MLDGLIGLGIILAILILAFIIGYRRILSKLNDMVSWQFFNKMLAEKEKSLIESMVESLEGTEGKIPDISGLADLDYVKKAVATEKSNREASDNDTNTQLRTYIETEVAGAKRLVEGVQQEIKGLGSKIEALNNALTKVETGQKEKFDILKQAVVDGDQKTYNALGALLDERVKQERQLLEDLIVAFNDFKTKTFEKSEELRKASGVFYPVEILTEKLGIETDIAQNLINAGYDSIEKVAQAEVITLIVTFQGAIGAKELLAIQTKAKEVISIQETIEEIKESGTKVTESEDKDGPALTFVEKGEK